ncbi:MAG TPA: hypothetical protein DDW49_07775 [Deltaproteobacteria bacterium]|nr:MAG: hypothetical protein A2048_07455 [Deltaproteobacteria bacterium GWA2_45_12]HBF13268.1 hypothetical protein [Deltaproteobacteria bacterium]
MQSGICGKRKRERERERGKIPLNPPFVKGERIQGSPGFHPPLSPRSGIPYAGKKGGRGDLSPYLFPYPFFL